tara:strand:- start:105 stop:293 length:189 start_codon:yes stop_codon:yes gene_type:complete
VGIKIKNKKKPGGTMEMIGGYTLVERLEMTIENIKFQKGEVFWDDLEKLELILKALKNKEVA